MALNTQTGSYQILLSTDENLNALTILNYYRLRFQIEFLIRDAKQHAGLEECQARSKKKLSFHFNMSLTSVTVTKTSKYLSIPPELRTSFSMESVKRLYHNKILAEFIFANLDLSLNCNKKKILYYKCLSFGKYGSLKYKRTIVIIRLIIIIVVINFKSFLLILFNNQIQIILFN